MNSPTIRLARLADLAALTALESRFPSDRLSRASLRRFVVAPSAEIWVAECEDTVVGDAVLLYRRHARRARLYSLVVEAARTGQGFGRTLLEACEKAARERGCRELVLEVRPDNLVAIGLYERAGFRVVGRREAFYEDGTTAIVLGKSLRAAPAHEPIGVRTPQIAYA